MFHPSKAGRDVVMQREGSRGPAERSFLSDVISFLSRIFSFHTGKKSGRNIKSLYRKEVSSLNNEAKSSAVVGGIGVVLYPAP